MAKRQTILLIPALLCDERLYEAQISALSGDFDVRVVDTTKDDSLDAMARRLLENAPESFALVGNSMGGFLALHTYSIAPARVSHIALIGTSARADTPDSRAKREQAIRDAEAGDMKAFVDWYAEVSLHPAHRAEFGPLLRDMAMRRGADVLVRQQKAIMGRADMRGRLPTFRVPALVISGADDPLSPPDWHHEMAKALPDATIEVIGECGHLVPLERPAVVTASLRRLMDR